MRLFIGAKIHQKHKVTIMIKAIALSLTSITLCASAFANEITVSESIKQCYSSQSDGTPFTFQIVEIFDGIIFADYNIGGEFDRPFNRLFKELEDGSWYFRSAKDDYLTELTINTSYNYKTTNLITEAIEYDYSNPNVCEEISITETLTYNEEEVQEHCDKEWTKRGERDDRMFDYCIEKQNEGFNDLKEAVVKYENTPFIGNMFIDLIDNWTERGFTDYNQIDFQLRNNGESYLNIEWELNNADEEVRPILRKHLIYTFDPKEASYRHVEYRIEDDR